jgi:hypothetical protein
MDGSFVLLGSAAIMAFLYSVERAYLENDGDSNSPKAKKHTPIFQVIFFLLTVSFIALALADTQITSSSTFNAVTGVTSYVYTPDLAVTSLATPIGLGVAGLYLLIIGIRFIKELIT